MVLPYFIIEQNLPKNKNQNITKQPCLVHSNKKIMCVYISLPLNYAECSLRTFSVILFIIYFFFFWLAALASTQFWNFAPVHTAMSPLLCRRATFITSTFGFADICVCAQWKQAALLRENSSR